MNAHPGAAQGVVELQECRGARRLSTASGGAKTIPIPMTRASNGAQHPNE